MTGPVVVSSHFDYLVKNDQLFSKYDSNDFFVDYLMVLKMTCSTRTCKTKSDKIREGFQRIK